MKALIEQAVRGSLRKLARSHPELNPDAVAFTVAPPKQPEHGDYATNAALVAGGLLDIRDRRGLAEVLAAGLEFPDGTISRVTIAGPGFLNFHVDTRWYQRLVADIVAADERFGSLSTGADQPVQVEFVSANPTGPLTIGHGRNAVLGDVVARLYERAGYRVTREYYFNNAGRQMRMLGESVRARYLAALGETLEWQDDYYQGDYVDEIAAELRGEHGESLRETGVEPFQQRAEQTIFADIRGTLERLSIDFDVFFTEDTLYRNGGIDRVVDELAERDLTYEQEGAVWLRGEQLGLDRDVVLIKSSGEPTYRLPDIAYHRDKLARGFVHIVDVLGADHKDETDEVMAALRALGEDIERIHVILYQFVTLRRGNEVVKVSTRKANYLTIDEVIDEVGADAVRYFFCLRSPSSHMEFDLELARKQANDNPMYYVQYAHARICSMMAKPEARALLVEPLTTEALQDPAELSLIAKLALLPNVTERALAEHEPQKLTTYAAELATAFHAFYDRCPVLKAEPVGVARARLELCQATRIVLRNTLQTLGVTAPESM